MCSPTAVFVATTVASGVASAYSQIQQGEYAEDIGKYNARVAENEAEMTRRAGTEAEMTHREKTMQLLSQQRAQLGAAGVDIGSGSALQLQEDTLTMGEADALRIRSNTEQQVESLRTQASLERSYGKAAKKAGYAGAFGTILSTGASVAASGVASKWFTPNSSALAPQGGSLGINLGSSFGGP